MTPKEKAEELVKKYEDYVCGYVGSSMLTNTEYPEQILKQAKQCAIIAVQFARQEFENHCAAEIGTDGSPDDHFNAIKQEIENI